MSAQWAEADSSRRVTVLSVTSRREDHNQLRELFHHTNWTLIESATCVAAGESISRNEAHVVLCETDLPDGDWKDVLELVRKADPVPQLIVTSRFADDRLWAEVLNLGGYDLLEKPFRREELVRVISLAWLQWKAQCRHQSGDCAAQRI